MLRQYFAAGDLLREWRQTPTERFRSAYPQPPDFSVVVRMVVPGWPQWYLGADVRARIFFGGFVGCLLLSLLLLGTTLGTLVLGLAISFHISSVVDVVFSNAADFRSRVVFTGACLVGLALFCYWPTVWATSQFVGFLMINQNAPPLQAGDVLVYNPNGYRWGPAKPGEFIVYDIPQQRLAGRGMQFHVGGVFVDRVLAWPGQAVEFRDGSIWVDGVVSVHRPVADSSLPNLQITVPADRYFVFPSTLIAADSRFASSPTIYEICCVPAEDVLGSPLFLRRSLFGFESLE